MVSKVPVFEPYSLEVLFGLACVFAVTIKLMSLVLVGKFMVAICAWLGLCGSIEPLFLLSKPF